MIDHSAGTPDQSRSYGWDVIGRWCGLVSRASSERELAEKFLTLVKEELPAHCAIALRLVDIASGTDVDVCGDFERLQEGLSTKALSLSSSDLSRLPPAFRHSARLLQQETWVSPFRGMGQGFSLPLISDEQLCGVLDVAYPSGICGTKVPSTELQTLGGLFASQVVSLRLKQKHVLVQRQNQELSELSSMLVIEIGPDYRVMSCNDALSHALLEDARVIIGRDIRDWEFGDSYPFVALLEYAKSGRARRSMDVELRTLSGKTILTRWSVVPTQRRDASFVFFGRDQTVLRNLEKQVSHVDRLATLGRLAAGVAHELNNPLTSIKVYTDYLVDKCAEANEGQERSDELEKLQRIQAATGRISALTRDLVDYANPSQGEHRPLDVTPILMQSMWFCEHLSEEKHLSIQADFAKTLPSVKTAGPQIEQIMINLVTNAIHASPPKGRIFVSSTHVDDEVIIEVRDEGEGVPGDLMDKICEPFFTTKEPGVGTGLGLAIVKNIVDQHQGRLIIKNSRSGGACFQVVLPISQPSPLR